CLFWNSGCVSYRDLGMGRAWLLFLPRGFLRTAGHLFGLVVTFVGLPGTGKSTLLPRVLEILRQRGAPCDASDEIAYRKMKNKLVWTVRETLGHPRFAWRSLKGIVASRQRSVIDLLKMVANWFARAFLIRRAVHSFGIHLIDEDIFQV